MREEDAPNYRKNGCKELENQFWSSYHALSGGGEKVKMAALAGCETAAPREQ